MINPFTEAGYQIHSLRDRVARLENQRHEFAALNERLGRLESTMRELRDEVNGLRRQCETIRESFPEEIARWYQDNGQSGVGA